MAKGVLDLGKNFGGSNRESKRNEAALSPTSDHLFAHGVGFLQIATQRSVRKFATLRNRQLKRPLPSPLPFHLARCCARINRHEIGSAFRGSRALHGDGSGNVGANTVAVTNGTVLYFIDETGNLPPVVQVFEQ